MCSTSDQVLLVICCFLHGLYPESTLGRIPTRKSGKHERCKGRHVQDHEARVAGYDIISRRTDSNPPTTMHFRSLSRAIKPAFTQPVRPIQSRTITSSFPTSAAKTKVAEGEAPLFKPPSDPNKLSARDLTEGTYEKELETSSEPFTTHSGTRSYVVNEPDPADSKYEIPTGAYHSTASYEKVEEVRYEGFGGEKGVREGSSTSSEVAHPVTTKMDKEGTKEGVDGVLESGPSTGKT